MLLRFWGERGTNQKAESDFLIFSICMKHSADLDLAHMKLRYERLAHSNTGFCGGHQSSHSVVKGNKNAMRLKEDTKSETGCLGMEKQHMHLHRCDVPVREGALCEALIGGDEGQLGSHQAVLVGQQDFVICGVCRQYSEFEFVAFLEFARGVLDIHICQVGCWAKRLDEGGQGDQQAVIENSKYFALQKRKKWLSYNTKKKKEIVLRYTFTTEPTGISSTRKNGCLHRDLFMPTLTIPSKWL